MKKYTLRQNLLVRKIKQWHLLLLAMMLAVSLPSCSRHPCPENPLGLSDTLHGQHYRNAYYCYPDGDWRFMYLAIENEEQDGTPPPQYRAFVSDRYGIMFLTRDEFVYDVQDIYTLTKGTYSPDANSFLQRLEFGGTDTIALNILYGMPYERVSKIFDDIDQISIPIFAHRFSDDLSAEEFWNTPVHFIDAKFYEGQPGEHSIVLGFNTAHYLVQVSDSVCDFDDIESP